MRPPFLLSRRTRCKGFRRRPTGAARERVLHVEIDGRRVASVRLQGEHAGESIERDYPIPAELVAANTRVRIRFQPERGFTAGPVFGCRIFRPDA